MFFYFYTRERKHEICKRDVRVGRRHNREGVSHVPLRRKKCEGGGRTGEGKVTNSNQSMRDHHERRRRKED